MNSISTHQSPPLLSVGDGGAGGGSGSSTTSHRQTHLTKFAFLLSSARGEGSDEPVVGMQHDVEMAECFSSRHLHPQQHQNGQMGMCPPPSISSSSLSMENKSGVAATGVGSSKQNLMEVAARNMSTPFYTTPDTVTSTAKTVLRNIVSTMEELIDSRLRSTIRGLVTRSSTIPNSQLLFRLLSPNRHPIKVATVITRFVLPDSENGENGTSSRVQQQGNDMLSIPLLFKAILDIKVFGEVSTIELTAPVTLSGKFDPNDGLLTAVNISFDCVSLLQCMIAQARLVVKTAVTKAAGLSVQISDWHRSKKSSASVVSQGTALSRGLGGGLGNVGTAARPSALSLHSLLGSSISLSSLSDMNSLFTTFPSLNKLSKNVSKGLLRNSTYSKNSAATTQSAMLQNQLGGSNNANATFDFGRQACMNNTLINSQAQGVGIVNNPLLGARNNSVVRFSMPNNSTLPPNPKTLSNPFHLKRGSSELSVASTSQSSVPNNEALLQQVTQVQHSPEQEPEDSNKGNIHVGLFSWLQNDSMFLTNEKIQEQNEADAERERKRREAPMPLRFFTAADDLGVGASGLEMVSKSIFGDGSGQDDGVGGNKRRKMW